jgi:replicative superfamily II helicase
MSDTLLDTIASTESVRDALKEADRVVALQVLGIESARLREQAAVEFNADALDIVALRAVMTGRSNHQTRRVCLDAFELLRGLITARAQRPIETPELEMRVRAAAFALLADRPTQARQVLDDVDTDSIVAVDADWGAEIYRSVLLLWSLVIRRRGWDDLDGVHDILTRLREVQHQREPTYLEDNSGQAEVAWRLVVAFHLLRAAEIIAEYQEHGSVDGRFDPIEQAEAHFDRAAAAADGSGVPGLGYLARLLDQCSRQLIANSVWRVARGAGSRVAEFVGTLASRDRSRPVLDLLPPQRQVLLEEGLVASGRRSIVVSLPTSAGKTLIAQFRVLQALDRYEREGGWVAYTAPTRALVNQITARFRRDLAPLGVRVERVSPALEVDSVEEELLATTDEEPFRVLVATPEKLDLLLRGGWVAEVGRPLTLVVVDEAHNLASEGRGLKLELLLATVNSEAREASFLLLTPFIPNGQEIASWLDNENSQAIELGLEWLPNDRIIGLARLDRGSRRGDAVIQAETLVTSGASLHVDEPVTLASGRPLGLTHSSLKTQTALAAATAAALHKRGSSVVLVQQPAHSWKVAEQLAQSIDEGPPAQLEDVAAVKTVLAAEYGSDYPLVSLIDRGVGVHHSGLSDEVRLLLEWLTESGALHTIVATTTLAQGMNFPVSNVVLATHQYPYGEVMPPEDFWNIAGRAGRADHGQAGVVLLAAPTEDRAITLAQFVERNVTALNSTLVQMVQSAISLYGDLDLVRLSLVGSWSSFLQFIAHTYRQVGDAGFAAQVEQVLRGTLGFRSLRASHPDWADLLVRRVNEYSANLAGKPLSLVDATGFSWESVSATLARLSDTSMTPDSWTPELLEGRSPLLTELVGVLLRVPELREQLLERLDPAEAEGDFIARVVKDWVAGRSIQELASDYFMIDSRGNPRDPLVALTRCCQRLFGSILPGVSWGLSALQALSLSRAGADAEVSDLGKDVPAFVFYGVNSREAVALRLFGVPRTAASALAPSMAGQSAAEMRASLASTTDADWRAAVGESGGAYYRTWRLVEGMV